MHVERCNEWPPNNINFQRYFSNNVLQIGPTYKLRYVLTKNTLREVLRILNPKGLRHVWGIDCEKLPLFRAMKKRSYFSKFNCTNLNYTIRGMCEKISKTLTTQIQRL